MSKRKLLFLIKILFALIVLLWVVQKVQYQTIVKSLHEPQSPVFIYVAVFLVLPNMTLQWVRWHILLRLIQPDVKKRDSLMSLFGGITVGLVTPGRIGEFGRAFFLKHVNHIKAMGLVFIDKFYAAMIMIIFGLWGVIGYLGSLHHFNRFLMAPLVGLGTLLTTVCLLLMFSPNYLRTFFYNLTLILPFRNKMKLFIDGLDHFRKEQSHQLIILSILLYMIYIFQFCLLASAFEKLSVFNLYIATTATMFTKILLPFSFGDLGIREGAAVYFFRNLGAQEVTAFNGAFLLFLLNVMFPALIGLIFIPRMVWRENDPNENP